MGVEKCRVDVGEGKRDSSRVHFTQPTRSLLATVGHISLPLVTELIFGLFAFVFILFSSSSSSSGFDLVPVFWQRSSNNEGFILKKGSRGHHASTAAAGDAW